MARVAINTGASANDGTGDNLRSAGGILNNNFLELYTYLGAGSTTVLSAPLWSSTNVGINTLRNVGIGTTNPTSALTVTGNGTFTGVVTATTFVGALTGTATTATNAQGLTGTPNITVGVATASRLNVGTGGTVITTTTAGLVGIGTTNPTSKLHVLGDVNITGIITVTDSRLQSVSEKSTIVSGNTVSLVYNTGGGNVAICTNPTGAITLNVTGIPTDSSFDNRTINFTVVAIQTSTGYACATINLNGVSRTTVNGFLKYPGGVVSVASTNSYDIFNFTGINTVGSGSTTENYQILGMVNGNFK